MAFRPVLAHKFLTQLLRLATSGVIALVVVPVAVHAEDAPAKSDVEAMQAKQRDLLRQYQVEPVSPDVGPVTLDDMILDWTEDGYVLAARFASGLEVCPAEEPATMSLVPLRGLTKLRAIELNAVAVAELQPLTQWKGLRDVKLIGCGKIKNIAVLGQLTQLDKLKLQRIRLDVSPILTKLVNLTELELPEQNLSRIDGVRGMAKLIKLDVSDNPKLSDIKPLIKLRYLAELDISGTAVTDLKPLLGLAKLTKLTVSKGLDTSLLAGRRASGLVIEER
jgi:Leucine-rich repeat (LRR) protein